MRSWGVGKLGEISMQMEENGMDFLAVTQTTMREEIEQEWGDYRFKGIGRKRMKNAGGGIGIIYNEKKGVRMEVVEFSSEMEEKEDIGVFKISKEIENRDGRKMTSEIVLMVCYMGVEGHDQEENNNKYTILGDLVQNFQEESIMIMGDMNAHTGILGEKVNRNGKKLTEFAEDYDMEIMNHTIAQGKVTWEERGLQSAIDYVLINGKGRGLIKEMIIDEEGLIMDTNSDHNLILVQGIFGRGDQSRGREGNEEVNNDRERYIGRTDWFWKHKGRDFSKFEIDLAEMDEIIGNNSAELNDNMVKTLNQVATRNFSRGNNKYRGKGKPKWWSQEIEKAIKERKKANRIRRRVTKEVKKGKASREQLDGEWANYMEKKEEATNKINKAIKEYERKTLNKIKEMNNGESREWYQFIKGDNGKTETYPNGIRVGKKNITGTYNIQREIEKYWTNISGKVQGNIIHTIDENSINQRREIEINTGRPSKEEIQDVLENLKNNKGVGFDGIPYEFYKRGGQWMVNELYKIFGIIWENEEIPTKWNESKVKLIYKGSNKSKKELGNYRPVSLANTIGKIFTMVLNNRLKAACEEGKVLGEEQNGFRVDRRGEDNIYVLREIVEKYQREKKELFLAFLDVEKAYDKMNREQLMFVLRKLGIPEKIRKIIKGMYTRTKAKYIFGDIETDWVKLERGVRQGCVLSPLLFAMYIEELAVRLVNSRLGVKVGQDKLGVLLYADDIILLAENGRDMQEMLNTTRDYAREFSMTFGETKCGVMRFNTKDTRDFKLGGINMKRFNKYKYLGIRYEDKGMEGAKNEKIFKANQWWGRLGSIAKLRANRYEIVRGMWKNIAVPGIMYGMNVLGVTEKELKDLEIIQNKIGRLALGGNKLEGVEAIRGEMGWSTFEERYIKATLKYKVRLEKMGEDRWAKKVYRDVGNKSKWLKGCVRSVRKIQMGRKFELREGVRDMDWKLCQGVGEEGDFEVDEWKVIINRKVEEYGLEKWRRGMENKSTMEIYKKKRIPKKESCYEGGGDSVLLFELKSKWCHFCEVQGSREEETIIHLLTECSAYEPAMEWAIDKYIEKIGERDFHMKRQDEDRGLGYFLGLEEGVPEGVVQISKAYINWVWSIREREIEGWIQGIKNRRDGEENLREESER